MENSIKFINCIKPDTVYIYQYFIDRSNAKEVYDDGRVKEIQKIFHFAKKSLIEI
jgi:hypothetical protein